NNTRLIDYDMSETSFIEGIQNVSRTDIQQLAQETILDTIYILTKGGND
ncbi:insulinase family protein, partial [Staphylococcus equorum]